MSRLLDRTLLSNYVVWMFLLVPSSHAESYGDENWGKQSPSIKIWANTYLYQDKPESEPATTCATKECASVEPEDRDKEPNFKATVSGFIHILHYLTYIRIQTSSENPREVIPTTGQYIMASGKQALVVLQSAAAFIPVPLIREAIGVALKIMEICEDRCEVCTEIPRRKRCKNWLTIIIARTLPSSVKKSKSWKIGYTIFRTLYLKLLPPAMKTAVKRLSWRRRRVLSGISRTYSGSILRHWGRSLISNYVYITALWRRSTRTWMK